LTWDFIERRCSILSRAPIVVLSGAGFNRDPRERASMKEDDDV